MSTNTPSATRTSSATSATHRGKRPAAPNSEARRDVCQLVTDKLVSLIEAGVKPWAKSWNNAPQAPLPMRHNGERYRGVNILLLWAQAIESGFGSPYWMTYRQAQELGAQVRKGEKGTLVCYYGTATQKDESSEGSAPTEDGQGHYRFLKTFTVFNVQQIDGLPERYAVQVAPVRPASDRIEELDALVAATGAKIHHGGNRAYYRPSSDAVQMPNFEQFASPEAYYATLFHELAHWTKAPTRLARDFGSARWGDEGYAIEELVAELAAAFLGAELGFPAEHLDDHAAYLASWLKALKNDKRLVFMAAAKAQAAVDYLTA